MLVNFAKIGPSKLEKLIKREAETISCETESNAYSNTQVKQELFNGRKLILDFRYDEVEKILYKVVVEIKNLREEHRFGGITWFHYDLQFQEVLPNFPREN